jgi:hypothetical protein
MVGTDDAGVARAAAFFAYNRNHTWAAQHAGAQLNAIADCEITLRALNTRAPAVVTWYDTDTGLPLEGKGRGAPAQQLLSSGGTDLVFAAPSFTADVAALALMEG